jgi:1-acyl-sn-glycerol-3-phosphate acyltransferase
MELPLAAPMIRHTLMATLRALALLGTRRLDDRTANAEIHRWGQTVIDGVGLKVDVRGQERVDWSRAYIVMSNHQSNLDPPLMAAVVPAVRFVAKAELRKVPLWGAAMQAAGMIFINRSDRAQATASLNSASTAIARGLNIWIAPEGTRTHTGELGQMKKGGFMLALGTGTPIVPIAISGTRAALPRGTMVGRHGMPVRVEFGAPIPVAGRQRDDLIDEVRQFYVDKVVERP